MLTGNDSRCAGARLVRLIRLVELMIVSVLSMQYDTMSRLLQLVRATIADALDARLAEHAPASATPMSPVETLNSFRGSGLFITYAGGGRPLRLGLLLDSDDESARAAVVREAAELGTVVVGVRIVEVSSAEDAIALARMIADLLGNLFAVAPVLEESSLATPATGAARPEATTATLGGFPDTEPIAEGKTLDGGSNALVDDDHGYLSSYAASALGDGSDEG